MAQYSTNDDNDSISSEEEIDRDNWSFNNQRPITKNNAVGFKTEDSHCAKIKCMGFREICNTASDSLNLARNYSDQGHTEWATEAYENTHKYCVELENRIGMSGEKKVQLTRKLFIMKLEWSQQLDEMANDNEANESLIPQPITYRYQFNNTKFSETLYQDQSFTDNAQSTMKRTLVVDRLVRLIDNKNSCNNYSDHGYNLFPKQIEQQLSKSQLQMTRQCIVDMMEQPLDQFEERYSDHCQPIQRTICNTCVYMHVKAAVEDRQRIHVTCPEPNCPAVFRYNEVHRILLQNNDRKLSELYGLRLTERLLEQMSDFISCPYPDCDSGQLNESTNSARNWITCIKCKRKICARHRTIWHTDMTCDQYDQSNQVVDNRTKKWLGRNSKQCPQCEMSIEKRGGCDHMTCKKCEYQFCWECLADYRMIAKQGLHRHQPACSHHPNQHAESRPTTSRNGCRLS